MSDVGDLLELLHGAIDRWTTAQFTIRRWQHLKRSEIATERWLASTGHSAHRYVTGDVEEPETFEATERVWIAKPDRFRHEHRDFVRVQRGQVYWSYSPQDGYASNHDDDRPHGGDVLDGYAVHLDPASILPQASFERLAPDTVHATPRETAVRGPGLPHGADDHLLTVDPVRGVVLRVESRIAGEPFAVAELDEVVWDDPIDDAVFTIELPPGRRWRSPREHRSRVTLEEAAERASFAVFAIGELPEGNWRLDVHHHESLGDRAPEAVTLLYHRADGRRHIQAHQHSAGESHPWTRLQGASFFVAEREGTLITLQSEDFSEGELRALAGAMVRV